MGMSKREKENLNNRMLAMNEFFTKLDEFGGYFTIDQLIQIGFSSHENIINQINEGRLIALKHHDNYLIPAFQFVGNQKLPHLEDILSDLTHVSNLAKCSFFLNSFYGSDVLVYKMLNSGLSAKRLEYIKKDARNFMKNITS